MKYIVIFSFFRDVVLFVLHFRTRSVVFCNLFFKCVSMCVINSLWSRVNVLKKNVFKGCGCKGCYLLCVSRQLLICVKSLTLCLELLVFCCCCCCCLYVVCGQSGFCTLTSGKGRPKGGLWSCHQRSCRKDCTDSQ